jgi:hypothetical protein
MNDLSVRRKRKRDEWRDRRRRKKEAFESHRKEI